ncbi:MAG: hypothetical protein RLZZ230_20 [Candidatus Parcubacteria bacterium]|jgi:multidrug efflux pump subunit AcrA (membrane-fusion protein)
MTSKRGKLLITVALGIIVSVSAFSVFTNEVEVAMGQDVEKQLTNKIYLSTSTLPVLVSGVVEAADSATIYAETAGVITVLPLREGALVTTGQVLSRQATPVANAHVQLAQAELGLVKLQQAQSVELNNLSAKQATVRTYSAQEIATLRTVSNDKRVTEAKAALLKTIEQNLLTTVTAIDYVNNNRPLFSATGLRVYDSVVKDLYGTSPKYFIGGVQHTITNSADILPLLTELKNNPSASVTEVQTLAALTAQQLNAVSYLFTTAESDVFDRGSSFMTPALQTEYLNQRTAVLAAAQIMQVNQATTEQVIDRTLEEAVAQNTTVSVTDLDEQLAATQNQYAVKIANQSELVSGAAIAVAAAEQSLGVVTSPFSGIVSKVYAHVGEYVTPGTPLFTLVGTGARELRVSVPAYLLPSVSIGQSFSVDGEAQGFVNRFSAVSEGGSGEVIITLTSDADMTVGASVIGYLELVCDKNIYQVPRTYIHFTNNGPQLVYASGVKSAVEIIYDSGAELYIQVVDFKSESLKSVTSISF